MTDGQAHYEGIVRRRLADMAEIASQMAEGASAADMDEHYSDHAFTDRLLAGYMEVMTPDSPRPKQRFGFLGRVRSMGDSYYAFSTANGQTFTCRIEWFWGPKGEDHG